MTDVKKLAKRYQKKYQSNDPFKLAKELDINVITYDLGEIAGLFKIIKRIKFIFINERLDERMQRFTLAHELGHAILHHDKHTLYYLKQLPRNEMKIEAEANKFATHFLINEEHEHYEIRNKYQIGEFYNLPKDTIDYI